MSFPPYLRRKPGPPIGAAGRASEKQLTRQLGGKARPASGAMEGAKGDIDLDSILLEAKSTVKDGMRVQLDWLAKISGRLAPKARSRRSRCPSRIRTGSHG